MYLVPPQPNPMCFSQVGNYYGVFHMGGGPVLPQSQMPYGGGFSWGPWINSKFVDAYLHSSKTLPALPNGSSFQLVDHVAEQRAKGLTPIELTREPILHEYIRFTQNQTVGRWVDMRRGAKAQAKKEPRPYPLGVYGNLECMAFQQEACGWQQNVRMVTLSRVVALSVSLTLKASRLQRQPIMTAPWVDVIVLEAATVMQEFKVALAAGNFEKPVFPFPDTCPDPCDGPAALARAMGATPASGTANASWYGKYRHLVTDRRSVADIAVVLDLPVFFWRGFSSLAVPGNQPHVLAMQNMTALLDEEHTPYDVLFEGHPDFYDDTKHWARLQSYRTLVLPLVESISDAHIDMIRRFASGGGHVVVLGDASGSTDEEDRPRQTPAFASLQRDGLVTWVNDSVLQAFVNNRTGAQRETIIGAMQLDREPLVSTDLPSTVPLHVWLHGNGPMLSVQIANADTHRTTRTTSNSTHELSLRLDGKSLSELDQAHFYSWSLPGGAPIRIPFRVSSGRIAVTVPPFERFGAVVFAAAGEEDARAAAGLTRKLTQRLELACTVTPGQTCPTAVLGRARGLLDSVQGQRAVKLTNRSHQLLPQLDAVARELQSDLLKVRNESGEFNRLSREATTKASNAAVRVDFSGSPTPSPPGWIRVGPKTMHSTSVAAGWTGASQAHPGPAPAALKMKGSSGVPQPCPFPEDAVVCSYLYSNSTARSDLRVTVPRPGNYTVEVVMGEPSAMVTRIALTNVWDASGELLAVGHRMPVHGEFTSIAFPVTVGPPPAGEAPALSMSLGGMAVSQFFEYDDRSSGGHAAGFYYTLSWIANAMIIRAADAQLPPSAAQSVAAHEVVAAGVRDWLVLGPIDDSNATCIDNPAVVPPPSLNVTGRYPRKGGGVATWQRAKLNGSLAYLDFNLHGIHDGDGLGASALALTHVKLSGDEPKRVLLVGSTAGVGVGWLGPTEVFRDELNAGLMLSEERTEVLLQPGWNTLLVRSCTKWATPGWGIWLGLRGLDGGPTDALTIDACGPLC